MADLSCEVMNCSYNKEKCCCKGDIMVGGKHATNKDATTCESFVLRKGDSYTSAIDHPTRMISIDCEAIKCSYNSNYRCTASKVNIQGKVTNTSQGTLCATFKE